ncbi:hypothetical protein [Prevotella sp.]|uniref:hypothetical protein n=1 Tax=Prevotella sp. TaxID=59823 RepID=UPI002F943CE7
MTNRWLKVIILVAFHGLMMTDFYYWEQAKNSINLLKTGSVEVLRQGALGQVNILGGLLIANVTLIAILVILLLLRKKK